MESWLVAKPIRKTPESEIQRLAIQDDFDIEHQGLLVSPLGVGSSLVFKTQLFLLFHPVLCHCECFKPGRRPSGLVVRKLFPIYQVSQLDLGADLKHEARFDTLNDLALDLVSNGVLQIQVEAKQERSPALFYSVCATLINLVELLWLWLWLRLRLWVVQRIKLFHVFVRHGLLTHDSLLVIKPSIKLSCSVTTPLSLEGMPRCMLCVFHRHARWIPGGGVSAIG